MQTDQDHQHAGGKEQEEGRQEVDGEQHDEFRDEMVRKHHDPQDQYLLQQDREEEGDQVSDRKMPDDDPIGPCQAE